MDPGTPNVGMLVFHQRAKSGDAIGRLQAQEVSPSTDTTPSGTKHKSRSLSWLATHRRKDSGISISTRSFRVASPVSVRSIPSSPGSRLSRESDRLSDSNKPMSASNDEAAALSDGPRSPPKRPQRPAEGLFDSVAMAEADQERNEEEAQAGDASGMGSHMKRRSRELLGLAYEAVGAVLPDARNRSSYASTLSDFSAPSPIIPTTAPAANASRRQRLHQKALSETAAMLHLGSSHSHQSPKQSASSRWTLTESMADMFKSQKLPKPDKATIRSTRSITPTHVETLWSSFDESPPQKERKRKRKMVKKLVTDAPMLGALIRSHQVADSEIAPSELLQRQEGSPSPSHAHEPTGPRQRAIPFEIAIPPPPTSGLYTHDVAEPRTSSSLARRHSTTQPAETREETSTEAVVDDEEHEQDDAEEDDEDADTGDEETHNDDAVSGHSGFLIPPPKNPARFAVRAPTMPHLHLPPIPEGFRPCVANGDVLQPSPRHIQQHHQRSRSLSQMGRETDECVYLRSTPFTLNNPGFRHGPITFQKSGMNRDSMTDMDSVEEVVDWAAFQAAIGGVGDLDDIFPLGKGKAESEDDESKIAEEVTAWFEEFGFETHGELIASEKPAERRLDRTSWDSVGSLGSAASVASADGEVRTPRQHHVFDTVKLLRHNISSSRSSTYSVSIYDGVDLA